jgi:hypothetical protein
MMMRAVLVFSLLSFISPILVSNAVKAEDVILFHTEEFDNPFDTQSYQEIARELNISSRIVDYRFINDKASFFNISANGLRKFKVLVLPGGEPSGWQSAFQFKIDNLVFVGRNSESGSWRSRKIDNRLFAIIF